MIADLHLENFRSYKNSSFEFDSKVNIIVGPNASGKTNLLESILVLLKGSSYRVKDSELVQFNKPWAKIEGRFLDGSTRTIKLTPQDNPKKQYEINGKKYSRLSHTQSLPVVLFEPNHLLLLSGGPEKRRDYLDNLLEQNNPGYNKLRRQYTRALNQRNTLLKSHSLNKENLFPWNIRLTELAGQIVRARKQLTKDLDTSVNKLYKDLSKTKSQVNLSYKSHWPADSYETKFIKNLEDNIELDTRLGFTSSGPHREDLMTTFNNYPVQDLASRGEIRTIILALKIAELNIIEDKNDTNPILLLDDVFSELDGKRRHLLTEYLNNTQVFITTTDADLVLQNFVDGCNIIPLK